MGGCCSSNDNDALHNEEDLAHGDLEEMLREQQGLDDAHSSRVELIMRCRNVKPLPHHLPQMPGFAGHFPTAGLSVPSLHVNPYVCVYEAGSEKKRRKFLGRTETRHRDHHPQFVKTVLVLYEFEQVQELRFVLYDERNPDQELGHVNIKLVDIINSSPYRAYMEKTIVTRNRQGEEVQKTHRGGEIIITAEEMVKNEGPQYEVMLELGCHSLEAKNLARGSDPFLVISRIVEGTFQPVVKTEYLESCIACNWKPIVLKLDKLCKGDFNAWLLIEVWDHENSGRHQLIGYTRQTLATLLSLLHKEIEIFNDNCRGKMKWSVAKGKKLPYERSGVLTIKSISIDTSHSFLEYVRSGFEINLTICVDFSSSNGPTNDPTSLHYCNKMRQDNEYTLALQSVVKVLGQYDKDQEFPFYGFGARRREADPSSPAMAKGNKDGSQTSHIFAVTGDEMQPCVTGLAGLIEAYWSCLEERMKPDEPTYFGNCLSKTYRTAAASNQRDSYQIVLIITDGQCNDLEASVDMIVEMSEQPISVIIIGVGDGPFDKMRYLSADDKPLQSSEKKTMQRDIVGFVPFREYKDSPEQLARETLKEIPRQFTSWAKIHKIKPEKIKEAKKDQKPTSKPEEKPIPEPVAPVEEQEIEVEEVVSEAGESTAESRTTHMVTVETYKIDESTGHEWESFSDDETGRRYYHNAGTKESTWEEPPAYSAWKAKTRASVPAPTIPRAQSVPQSPVAGRSNGSPSSATPYQKMRSKSKDKKSKKSKKSHPRKARRASESASETGYLLAEDLTSPLTGKSYLPTTSSLPLPQHVNKTPAVSPPASYEPPKIQSAQTACEARRWVESGVTGNVAHGNGRGPQGVRTLSSPTAQRYKVP